MPGELLSILKVAERISFSKSWIYREMAEGRFPRPLNLNFGKNLWSSEQINVWIAAQLRKASAHNT